VTGGAGEMGFFGGGALSTMEEESTPRGRRGDPHCARLPRAGELLYAVMKRWLPSLLFLGTTSGIAFVYACTSDTNLPQSPGNTVVNDTKDAGPSPSQTAPPPPDSSIPDGGNFDYDSAFNPPPDGYDPVGVCNTCACLASAKIPVYCFGGGTGQTTFDGVCALDGASPTSPTVGCVPIPQACTSNPSCACILQAIGKFPCYLQCVSQGGSASDFAVYCSNP
jgi:hypothetical protein